MSEEPESSAPADAMVGAVERLTARIDALQHELRRMTGGPLPDAVTDEPTAVVRGGYSWMSGLEHHHRRTPRTPRLLLEAIFLIGCAAALAVAELDPIAIAAVMAGAWLLVALIEWAASRADRVRHDLLSIPPPAPPIVEAAASDSFWDVGPIEDTQLDVGLSPSARLPRARDGELEVTP